mgnify:CR=1 FL=1
MGRNVAIVGVGPKTLGRTLIISLHWVFFFQPWYDIWSFRGSMDYYWDMMSRALVAFKSKSLSSEEGFYGGKWIKIKDPQKFWNIILDELIGLM